MTRDVPFTVEVDAIEVLLQTRWGARRCASSFLTSRIVLTCAGRWSTLLHHELIERGIDWAARRRPL